MTCCWDYRDFKAAAESIRGLWLRFLAVRASARSPWLGVLSQENAGNVLAGVGVDHDEFDFAGRPLTKFGVSPAIQIAVHDDGYLARMAPDEFEHDGFWQVCRFLHRADQQKPRQALGGKRGCSGGASRRKPIPTALTTGWATASLLLGRPLATG